MTPGREARQVVVLSTIDWSTPWQRHQIFAAAFAAAGDEVFFVENTGFRNPSWKDLSRVWSRLTGVLSPKTLHGSNPISSGLKVIAPRVMPPNGTIFRLLNRIFFIPALKRQLQSAGLRPGADCVVYVATPTTLELLKTLAPSVVVYDCVANFRAHPEAPADFPARERELLGLAGQVVCDSDFLYEQKKLEHPFVEKIHQGVPADFFRLPPSRGVWTDFCYYGMWSRALDPLFVDALASAGFRAAVRGFTSADAPALSPGVERHPPVERDALTASLAPYDGFILPYRMSEFMMGVVPAKMFEVLATGRPVIATPLPSLKALKDLIYIGETPQDWVRIARDLPRTETEEKRAARIALAREHSTDAEFRRFRACVDAARARRAK